MGYIIKNYDGFINNDICELKFGMTKNEIHNLLCKKPNSIMSTLEYYDDFRIDYDEQDNASAFEFFSSSKLYLNMKEFPELKNINLFTINFDKLNKIITCKDSLSKVDSSGIISLKYGVGTYQEDSEEEICESIIIFKKGYYDSIYG